MIRLHGEHPVMESAVGPLCDALWGMNGAALESICRLVEGLSSCYTGNETTGLPYLGSAVLRSGGARAAATLPLRTANASLGAIVLAHSRPMRLSAEVVEPLELLAGQAAATLNAVDLVHQLRQQARRDGLTVLLNRKALDEAIQDSDEHIRAVIITDVDHFKAVNERHGHPKGDQALKALAQKMTELVPESAVYRMGGDEFACLIPTDDCDTASYVAEKVRRVGRAVLAPWSTTLSVGVAVSEGHEPLNEILDRADAALFEVKRRGRGRVAVAS
jgi:diguanylate cyclase (GGDEF)-like protein